jgi:hypothetical protein
MKSIVEIQDSLFKEVVKYIERSTTDSVEEGYFNRIAGDISFLLAALLNSFMKIKYEDWISEKWLDDSLIHGINFEGNRLQIWGVMIWGRHNTTEQWTDPFLFEIELNKDRLDFKSISFWFCDLLDPELTFERFVENRNYYNFDRINWKYTIESNKQDSTLR